MKADRSTISLGTIIGFVAFWSSSLLAQDISIRLGQNQIALNEAFTITLTIQNEQLKSYSSFPDIPGFQKRGISSQSSTNIVNGQISFTQSVIQNYAPTKEGKFRINPFTMEVNGKKVNSSGTEIKVNPPRQVQQQDVFSGDPFEEFFGRAPREFVDVAEDAFFAVTTTKDKVYVGEGFTITIAFYVSETNRAEMNFYDLSNQLNEIIKKIRTPNCWEENYGIEEIQPEQVLIEGKKYAEYKLYRATYYPINKTPIKIPELGLKMIKYKIAKNPSFFSMNNKQQDFKTFVSKPKTITVRDLPPHPLKDQVSVGQFALDEQISPKKFTTGNSYNYQFKIVGEGNIASIRQPTVSNSQALDFYPPNTFQNITRSGRHVTGSKSFQYFIVPKEPQNIKLKDYIFWVYFNPATAKYDTLKPKLVMQVAGESTKNTSVSSSDHSELSTWLDRYHNKPISDSEERFAKMLANVSLVLLFLITLYIFIKR